MLRRLWRLWRVLFSRRNSDDSLARAQREMRARHVQMRLDAVHSFTDRSSLQILIRSTQEHIDELKARAELAVTEFDAQRLAREIKEYEEYLAIKQQRLVQAEKDVEEARKSIRREEERVRQKTAAALALKAQWKNRQIPGSRISPMGQVDPEQLARLIVITAVLVVVFLVLFLIRTSS